MNPRRRRLPKAPAELPILPVPTSWARERITAGRALGELPSYGDPQWQALPDGDPRKLAAALVAAEAHRYEAATLAERLARELDVIATDDAIEDAARAAMDRDEQLTEHARKVTDRGARMLAGSYPTAAVLAERRDDHVGFWRAQAQQARIAAVPPLAELMRRRA